MSFNENSHIHLIDGTSTIYRSFFGMPPMMSSHGNLNAVYGLCNVMMSYCGNVPGGSMPTHVAVVFDTSGDNFRSAWYDQYKATREDRPEELVAQEPFIQKAVEAFSITKYQVDSVEADDVIATIASKAMSLGGKATIITVDKDMMQLVEDGSIRMYDPMKKQVIRSADVEQKFGVRPSFVCDVQALCGDKSDNIPGVPGIGVKTAASLVNKWGSVEAILEAANDGNIKGKPGALLCKHFNDVLLSAKLVKLRRDVDLPIPIDDCEVQMPDMNALLDFFDEVGFKSMRDRFVKVVEEMSI